MGKTSLKTLSNKALRIRLNYLEYQLGKSFLKKFKNKGNFFKNHRERKVSQVITDIRNEIASRGVKSPKFNKLYSVALVKKNKTSQAKKRVYKNIYQKNK